MHPEMAIEWQIESIRTTVFLTEPLNSSALQSWFEKVSNSSAARLSITPTSFRGIARTTTGLLQANWAANRLDLILASEDPKGDQVIAPFSAVTDLFNQFMLPLVHLGELPPATRIAYGLVLRCQIQNEPEGLDLLSNVLTRVKLSNESRDFLYRLNIPVQSKSIPGLFLNRLVTWLVGQIQIVQVGIGEGGAQVQSNLLENPPFSIRVEMDLSTTAQAQLSFPPPDIEKLLCELSGIALDIAAHGESVLND